MLAATGESRERATGRLDQFLQEPSPWKALNLWVGTLPSLSALETKREN